MKKLALILAMALFVITNANAFDVKILANNKEANSREITKRDLSIMQNWVRNHEMEEEVLKEQSLKALGLTMTEEERIDTSCELGIINRLAQDAKSLGVIKEDQQVITLLTYLRSNDLIDDILYRMLKSAAFVNIEIESKLNRRVSSPRERVRGRMPDVNMDEFYAPVKTWPDDVTNCSLDTYFRMTNQLTWKSARDRDAQMQRLNYEAYRRKVIDQQTYNKLEVFRSQDVLGWQIYFKRYADVVYNAKDKLTKTPEPKGENTFSETYVSRKERITRRGRLYMTYDSTQVMMLAQLIEKTAKRMDARHVSLHFQYTDDPKGEGEVYIFSPMEQYRAAIKLLKKEMAEMMRSDAFKYSGMEFEDLIAAAYETGYIKSEELNYLLKFEDFWDPKTPRWKTYANFAFSLAGTATFYLPPPWNIVGAIGLVLSQSKLIKDDKLPDSDDNWNVII